MYLKLCFVFQLIGFVISGILPSEEADDVYVDIPNLGRIRGIVKESKFTKRPLYHFLGINYAKPPSGERRYQPPQEFEPFSEVYDARKMRQKCPQIDMPYYPPLDADQLDVKEDSEDCLVVNVFTPKNPNKKKDELYPVLFFIHGGSFYLGSAYDFQPDFLLEDDIVLVVIQYRLGVLGFMTFDNDEFPGNLGMLDILMGLEWVQKHIGAFGGDKTQVTIVGQSAGAAAASALMVSPLVTEDLFHRVIIESGTALGFWAVATEPETAAAQIADQVGCKANYTRVCMRNVPVPLLLKAHGGYLVEMQKIGKLGLDAGSLVVQKNGAKRFLEKDPKISFNKGEFLKVPVLGGVTRDEGTAFYSTPDYSLHLSQPKPDPQYYQRNITRDLLKMFGLADLTGELTDIYQKTYFPKKPKSIQEMIPGVLDMISVVLMKAATYHNVRLAARFSPSYAYSFNFYGNVSKLRSSSPTWDEDYMFPAGVAHSDELGYLFPSANTNYTEREYEMAKTMSRLWTNFVRTGKPAPAPKARRWPTFSEESGPYLRISDKPEVRDDIYDEYIVTIKEGFVTASSSTLTWNSHLRFYSFIAYLFVLSRFTLV